MLHTKHACNSGMQNVFVVNVDTDIIASLLRIADLLNCQLFQKKKKLKKDF